MISPTDFSKVKAKHQRLLVVEWPKRQIYPFLNGFVILLFAAISLQSSKGHTSSNARQIEFIAEEVITLRLNRSSWNLA